ncbi:MAG TPA: phosphopantetheine-binding protein [Candidatus Brocadiia bacterium]|nr:phosphopantetheine-binding protein [Candidatus Brocadiia bacterium]
MPDHADNIEAQLKEMLVERLFLDISPDAIANDAPLMETLGIDSTQVLEIIVGLEEIFGISFEDQTDFNIELFRTVSSIADYVRTKTGQA